MKNSSNYNEIHPTAKIGDNVILGKYNKIGKNVVIEGFKGINGKIKIGDCNIINDNTRILAGENGIYVGDWNIFHNNMLVMGEKKMLIGHNCWFGQNTILDSSGGLEIGSGVRVGMYSQIWTHVASGELIEGCTLFGKRKTIIKDNVWLVGSCIVSSGVVLGEKSIYLIGSNITKSTDSNKVYAGSPAKLIDKLNFYNPITLKEKYEMMLEWVKEFSETRSDIEYSSLEGVIKITSKKNSNEIILIVLDELKELDLQTSVFSLKTKTYTKRLTNLERDFYSYIFDHKARFIPNKSK